MNYSKEDKKNFDGLEKPKGSKNFISKHIIEKGGDKPRRKGLIRCIQFVSNSK